MLNEFELDFPDHPAVVDLQEAACRAKLYLHRYQTNAGYGNRKRIIYGVSSTPQKPRLSNQCIVFRTIQNFGDDLNVEEVYTLTQIIQGMVPHHC